MIYAFSDLSGASLIPRYTRFNVKQSCLMLTFHPVLYKCNNVNIMRLQGGHVPEISEDIDSGTYLQTGISEERA